MVNVGKRVEYVKMGEWVIFVIFLLLLVDLAIMLDIFLIRQILGFLYFTIVPGLLILQILRLYELEFSKKFVLSVGLSVSSFMFVGLALNCLYPLIRRPLSFYPVLISLNVFVIILTVLSYWRNKKDFTLVYLFNCKVDTKNKYISPILFSCLFPFLSVFGTYLVNTEGNNIILLTMLFLIPIYVSLIYLGDIVPESAYPVVVWMIGLSVALMYGLRSSSVSLSDGCIEYYLFQLTMRSSYWKPILCGVLAVSNYSVCLSITILAVMYKIICNLQSYYIFKLYYNVLLSIIPLTVYIISYEVLTDPRDRFVAAFFFISQYPYVSMMGWIIFRQIIAILFFALVFLVIFENLSESVKKILFLIFIFAMVFSHYSTTYIFFIVLLLYYIVNMFSRTKHAKIYRVNMCSILLVSVLIFFWYGLLSAMPYKSFVDLLEIASVRLTELSVESFKHSGEIFLGAGGVGYAITKYVYDISILIITIGILSTIFGIIRRKVEIDTFKIFVLISFGILAFLTILGSYLKEEYGYDRVYQQLLLVLSPMFVVGVQSISKRIGINRRNILLIALIVLQFLASTYVILQIFGVHHSEALNNDGIRYEIYYIEDSDLICAKWLYNHIITNVKVWSDYSGMYIYSQFDPVNARCLYTKLKWIRGYIYFRLINILSGHIYTYKLDKEKISVFTSNIIKMNKIYDNGATIYGSLNI